VTLAPAPAAVCATGHRPEVIFDTGPASDESAERVGVAQPDGVRVVADQAARAQRPEAHSRSRTVERPWGGQRHPVRSNSGRSIRRSFRVKSRLIVPARYNFLYSPQGRLCGRPPAGNATTVTGTPASPSAPRLAMTDTCNRMTHAAVRRSEQTRPSP
jgi:hypothetical protein